MLLDAERLDFDPERREYVQEMSQLKGLLQSIPRELTLTNCPEPGMHRSFQMDDVDKSGGDVAGWRYEEVPGPNRLRKTRLRVLLIND